MNKAKFLGLVSISVLAICGLMSFMPEETAPKLLTVRVYEASNSYYESKIIVVPEVGEPEVQSLASFASKNYADNTYFINGILNKVSRRGYELQSTSSSGDMNVFIHTYTFVKK